MRCRTERRERPNDMEPRRINRKRTGTSKKSRTTFPKRWDTKAANGRRKAPGRPHRAPTLDFDDVIYGIHAVEEALVAGERLRAIHVADHRQRDPLLRGILEQAKATAIPIRFEGRQWFAQL